MLACLRELARPSALNDSQVLDTAGGVIGPWHWQNVHVFGQPPSPRAGHSLSRSLSYTLGVKEATLLLRRTHSHNISTMKQLSHGGDTYTADRISNRISTNKIRTAYRLSQRIRINQIGTV